MGVCVPSVYEPLRRLPVLHTCGHFELRMMRFRADEDIDRGYAQAGNKCTHCGFEGRPLQDNYPSLSAAQAASMGEC